MAVVLGNITRPRVDAIVNLEQAVFVCFGQAAYQTYVQIVEEICAGPAGNER